MNFKIILISALTLFLTGCAAFVQQDEGIQIATSFYPIFDFASEVASGTTTRIINLTPAGVEPHDFEPSTKAIASIYNADAFIFNGENLDVWASKIEETLQDKGVKTLQMSKVVDLLNLKDKDTGFDPHFWLDPANAAKQVTAISALLQEVDPANAKIYIENEIRFVDQLQNLDNAYRTGLQGCQFDVVFTSHEAFNYLANRYDFEIESVSGFSPDEEPSPARLAKLADEIKSKGVKYIFAETLVSPRIAQTLASETGVQILTFNSIEGLSPYELKQGKTYLSIMEQNLVNLKTALNCQ